MRQVVLILALFAPLAALSAQRTLRVPSRYKTIPLAIAAAQTGDTVLVAAGMYPDPIDFSGKAIRVVSEWGPYATTIGDSRWSNSATGVTFETGEGPDSILDGFMVTGFCDSGMMISGASPIIRNCRIVKNRAKVYDDFFMVWACGGGIVAGLSNALLDRCAIIENVVSVHATSGRTGAAYGGGIYAINSTLQINRCVVAYNEAGASALFHAAAFGGGMWLDSDRSVFTNTAIVGNSVSADFCNAGGVYSQSQTRFINCIIAGNQAWQWPPTRGSGVEGGKYTNCIIRQNTPIKDQFVGTAEYCNIEGGEPGAGNIDADPKFIDYWIHLGWDSPCRDRGTNSVAGLPETDFEGHPRIAGGRVDIGMDEFYAGLDHVGTASPGKSIDIRVIGKPGAPVWLGFSVRLITPPLSIPGLEGVLHLNPMQLAVIPLGCVPTNSRLTFPFLFPPSFPTVRIPLQALVDRQLSNGIVLDVR